MWHSYNCCFQAFAELKMGLSSFCLVIGFLGCLLQLLLPKALRSDRIFVFLVLEEESFALVHHLLRGLVGGCFFGFAAGLCCWLVEAFFSSRTNS
jgi:predicted membrane channel-forming protein YqfA (hemolysin III family)